MAQTIKQEVQERIDEAALALFFAKGYRQTTMADIGRRAGISVGNIYRYYSNKQTLFERLIPEALAAKCESLLNKQFLPANVSRIKQLEPAGQQFLGDEMKRFLLKYRKQIVIIMFRSDGTRYETFKERITDLFTQRMLNLIASNEAFQREFVDETVHHAIRRIYSNLIYGFFSILKTFDGERDIEKSYQLFFRYHYFGIHQFL